MFNESNKTVMNNIFIMKNRLVINNFRVLDKMNISAVAFDFDDTLVKPVVAWQSEMAKFFVHHIYSNKINKDTEKREIKKFQEFIEKRAGTPLTQYMRELCLQIQNKGIIKAKTYNYYRNKFDLLWRKISVNLYSKKDLTPGVIPLIIKLKKSGISIYILTGGDRNHKIGLIKKLNLNRLISSEDIFGDCDPRFPKGFSKKQALEYITLAINKKRNFLNNNQYITAMIGDGEKDMIAANEVNGVLAVGFNQLKNADVTIVGNSFPVNELYSFLLKKDKFINNNYKTTKDLN